MNKPWTIIATARALLLCPDGLTKAQWRIIYRAMGGDGTEKEADAYFTQWGKEGYAIQSQGAVFRLVRA